MREKISACIITFNEERNIKRCLGSLAWADEIIVVDSGSSDGTEEICRSAGARFFVNPFSGFRDQKNTALSKASNEWIISLDADEWITEGLRDEVLRALEGTDFDGFYMPRMNHYGDKFIRHSGWYPDLKIRVWKRSRGKWVGRNVHERVNVDGKIGYFKNGIMHFTYRNVSDHLKRIDTYSSLSAQERFDSGDRFSYGKLLFKPMAKFLKSYIVKRGFMDGLEGFIIGTMSFYLKFLEEIKMKEHELMKRRQKSD